MRRRDRWHNASSMEEILTLGSTRDGDCLIWQGKPRSRLIPYGRFSYRGKVYATHRAAYLTWNGEIPEGHHIHHECGNPRCIEPTHLVAVTARQHASEIHRASAVENMLKAVAARRLVMRSQTHCKHGHELTPENTWTRKEGWRQCRMCNRDRQRARRAGAEHAWVRNG